MRDTRRFTPPHIPEPLERRLLLDAVVDGRTLGIRGTNGKDVITVNYGRTQANVRINGVLTELNVRDVDRIRIFLNGGNDRLTFDKATTSVLPATTVYGGLGNDTIEFNAFDGRVNMFLEEGADNVFMEGSVATGASTLFTSVVGGPDNDTIVGGPGRDSFTGDEGDDFLQGSGRDDTLRGGDGNDSIFGDNGNDLIHGDVGADTLQGGSFFSRSGTDDDTIFGGGGADKIVGGGRGADVLSGDAGDDVVNSVGGPGAVRDDAGDTITGGSGNDELNGQDGNDLLDAGTGEDVIGGDAGNDTLIATQSTNASLFGGGGNDTLTTGAGNDRASGGFGDDVISTGAGNDTALGEQGADSIDAGAGDDFVNGGGPGDDNGTHIDTLTTGVGADHVIGNEVDSGEVIDFDAGADSIFGRINFSGGTLSVTGSQDNDNVSIDAFSFQQGNLSVRINSVGGSYAMKFPVTDVTQLRVFLGGRNDSAQLFSLPETMNVTVYGGSGNDSLSYSGLGTLHYFGEDGDDFISQTFTGGGARTLYGGSGNDTLTGGPGRDYIEGGSGDDYLEGWGNADQIFGGSGNDAIDGGKAGGNSDGADTLDGGPGNDTLAGYVGTDQITGGSNADTFDASEQLAGEVLDFEPGVDGVV